MDSVNRTTFPALERIEFSVMASPAVRSGPHFRSDDANLSLAELKSISPLRYSGPRNLQNVVSPLSTGTA